MRVKAIKLYYDSRLNKQVEPGYEFEVVDTRGRALIEARVVAAVRPERAETLEADTAEMPKRGRPSKQ